MATRQVSAEILEMIKENVRNELTEKTNKKKAAESCLLDASPDEPSTADADFESRMPRLFSLLQPIVISGGNSKPSAAARNSNAECQTEENTEAEIDGFRSLRAAALEEIRRLRVDEVALAEMMKVVITLDEGKQHKFHDLMQE